MKLFLALAASLTLSSMAALAADGAAETSPAAGASTPSTRWAACSTEVQKFCADIERGKGKIRSCLEGHTAELSDGCKARMAEHAAKPN